MMSLTKLIITNEGPDADLLRSGPHTTTLILWILLNITCLLIFFIEYHFLCVCPVYNSRRTILFEEIELKHVHFHTLSLSDKFIFVMKHCQIEVSKFINETWSIRQTKL